jgi:hypothetical protein
MNHKQMQREKLVKLYTELTGVTFNPPDDKAQGELVSSAPIEDLEGVFVSIKTTNRRNSNLNETTLGFHFMEANAEKCEGYAARVYATCDTTVTIADVFHLKYPIVSRIEFLVLFWSKMRALSVTSI